MNVSQEKISEVEALRKKVFTEKVNKVYIESILEFRKKVYIKKGLTENERAVLFTNTLVAHFSTLFINIFGRQYAKTVVELMNRQMDIIDDEMIADLKILNSEEFKEKYKDKIGKTVDRPSYIG